MLLDLLPLLGESAPSGSSGVAGAPRRAPRRFSASGVVGIHLAPRVTGHGRATGRGRVGAALACSAGGLGHCRVSATVTATAVPRLALDDVRYLHLSPLLHDILLESWDDDL